MRPIEITMRAFGSYGRETRVDFSLCRQNLFLITGSTGSGKTTIFDAIVFALYGEAGSSENKKNGVELQSQYSPNEEPYVCLTFDEDGRRYRVRRVPRHLRRMKRGTGVREQTGSVELTMPDGTVWPARETDEKIEALVGLNKRQFMQVAMIAQGEFMDMLRARSDEKKVIFRKLFNTEFYKQVTDETARRKKEKDARLSEISVSCRGQAERMRIPVNGWEALEAIRARVTGERVTAPDLESLLEGGKRLTAALSEENAALEAEAQSLSETRDRCRDRYTRANENEALFRRLDGACETLERFRAEQDGMNEKEALAERLEKAFALRDSRAQADRAGQRHGALESETAALKKALPEREALFAAARADAEGAARLWEAETAALSVQREKTQRAIRLFDRIRGEEAEADRRRRALREAESAGEEALRALTALQRQEEECRRTEAANLDAEEKYTEWSLRSARLDALDEAAERCALAEGDLQKQRLAAQAAARVYCGAKETFEGLSARYEQARTAYLDAEAGMLAMELKEGRPCPVCGSLSHPRPALPAASACPADPAALEEMRARQEEARQKQEEAAASSRSALTVLEEKEKAFGADLEALLGKLRNEVMSAQDCGGARQAVRERQKALSEEGRALDAARRRLLDARARLKDIAGESADLQKRCTLAREEAAAAKTGMENAEKALELSVGESEYQSEQAASDALGEAEARARRAADVLKEKEFARDRAQDAWKQTETLIGNNLARLPELRAEADALKAAYAAKLLETDMTEEEWTNVLPGHMPGDVRKYRDEVRLFRNKLDTAEGALRSLQEALKGKVREDTAALKQAFDTAERAYTESRGRLEAVREDLKADSEAVLSLEGLCGQRAEAEQEQALLDRLYRQFSGNMSGSRMDLETYAQRACLQDILEAANVRFREMTDGQFEMRLCDLDRAGEGRNRGLDLMVYAYSSDSVREIRTLSGGESFMAALSLALGMADMIQAESASIHLEMMFIDEGFGSLDDHARSQAVRVLKRMAGADRLIGIISHVTELKQEIEECLLVSRDDSGSRVRWSDT